MDDQRQELRRWDQVRSRSQYIYCSCEKMHRLSLEKLSLVQVFQRVGDDTQKASILGSTRISCQSCESCGMILLVAFHLPFARVFFAKPKKMETCMSQILRLRFLFAKKKGGSFINRSCCIIGPDLSG